MKKTVITLAVVAFAAAAVQAQTTSANIVGYSKSSYTGGFEISAMQFDGGAAGPTAVYGDQLPSGSKIYAWDGSAYTIASYGSVFVPGQGLVTKWNSEPSMEAGSAYWVETSSAVDAIVAGEVNSSASVTNTISAGFSLVSYPYPVEVTVADLQLSPASGDKIYIWDGSSYTIVSYGSVFVPGQGLVTQWNNPSAVISVGQGFWYETTVEQEYVVNKPF
jgi:hypothetical protein